ncbi:conserved hypothetical protein [Marinobacter salarius]|uniref:hypothetical protein n=1 Tax=Marinobacter salarius TaxID=1420917 RepID=UPI00125102BF|nr:hypothetical protein [Marinobacter salarius]VVT02747.1 conserved hypothetical protein [Marinobacter salarius]VXC25320.1 conserved hypothetical protein [Marinobacter salarius]
MSNFDLANFRKAKFQERVEDVPLSGLTAAGFGGYEGDGDEAKPVPVVFRVRGLTAEELAKASQEADKSKLLVKTLEKLAGSEAEKIQGMMEALGISEDSPPDLAKKLAHVEMAVIAPKLKRQDVVRIAEAYPTDFLELSNQIYDLTGQGKVALVKRKPSGKNQTSKRV